MEAAAWDPSLASIGSGTKPRAELGWTHTCSQGLRDVLHGVTAGLRIRRRIRTWGTFAAWGYLIAHHTP